MKLSPRTGFVSLGAVLACAAIGGGTLIGVSSASSSDNPSGVANTAGSGGQVYATSATAAVVSVGSLPLVVQSELATVGATSVVPLASVGSGGQESVAYSATGANGANCIEFSNASGKIAEPPNCVAGANLRVSSEEFGMGNPDSGDVTSTETIAVVSTNVATVRVKLADGSLHDYAPDANGVVTIETTGDQPAPTAISAVDSAGATLATLGA